MCCIVDHDKEELKLEAQQGPVNIIKAHRSERNHAEFYGKS